MNGQYYSVYWWTTLGQHAIHSFLSLDDAARFARVRGRNSPCFAVLVVPSGHPVGLWRSWVSRALARTGGANVAAQFLIDTGTPRRAVWGERAA